MSFVRYTRDGRVARITLDRPEASNTINSSMMAALAAAVRKAGESGADVLAVTANGPDFSLGRDQHEKLPEGFTRADNVRLIVDANAALASFQGISVVAAHGRTLGFACGFVAQCDLSVVADDAVLGFDEIKHGRAPRFVMGYLADLVGPRRAMDLVVTGRPVSAAEAVGMGLVSRVVPATDLVTEFDALVAGLLESDGAALRTCKSWPRLVAQVEPGRRDEVAYEHTVGPAART